MLRDVNVGRDRSLDAAFIIITDLAAPLAYSIPFVLLFLSLYRKNKLLKSKSLFIIKAMALALAVNATLKHTIDRPRPFVTYAFIEKLSYGNSPSFPSGHTSDAFAMASALILAFPHRWLGFVVFFWAVLVGYSRMHLGVHYPSDVLASIVLAFLSAWFVWRYNKYKTRWIEFSHT
jgi:undecaprenyl-diphosphatase